MTIGYNTLKAGECEEASRAVREFTEPAMLLPLIQAALSYLTEAASRTQLGVQGKLFYCSKAIEPFIGQANEESAATMNQNSNFLCVAIAADLSSTPGLHLMPIARLLWSCRWIVVKLADCSSKILATVCFRLTLPCLR
jgi:hypothetical protein